MIQRATFVGELVARSLLLGRPGVVTRAFERSAYLRTGSDFILLLWGETRSPMTVNVPGRSVSSQLKPGEKCELSPSGIGLGGTRIDLRRSKAYRSSLLSGRAVALPDAEKLVKGVTMLRTLYDASPHGPTLPDDPSFRKFARGALAAYALEGAEAPGFDPFLPLVGRGGGFTPAGDDFSAGFTAAFNCIARAGGTRPITVPRGLVLERTVPESAAILVYSSQGYVDESLEGLILDTLDGRSDFFGDLESLAARGHTSGMDISLGVLLAEACALDRLEGRSSLEKCTRVLFAG